MIPLSISNQSNWFRQNKLNNCVTGFKVQSLPISQILTKYYTSAIHLPLTEEDAIATLKSNNNPQSDYKVKVRTAPNHGYRANRTIVGLTSTIVMDIDDSTLSAKELFPLLQEHIVAIAPSSSAVHLPPEECYKMRVFAKRPMALLDSGIRLQQLSTLTSDMAVTTFASVIMEGNQMDISDSPLSHLSHLHTIDVIRSVLKSEYGMFSSLLPEGVELDDAMTKPAQMSKPSTLGNEDVTPWILTSDNTRPAYSLQPLDKEQTCSH